MPDIDYDSWVNEITSTDRSYRGLFPDMRAFPPIFFFGNPENAVAATLGVNPSAQEFSASRSWHKSVTTKSLIERCKSYFDSPYGVPPHPWFEPWEEFLKKTGLSYYESPRAVHLDISPRATRAMGTLNSKEQIELFLSLGQNDLKYFVLQLSANPQITHLYAAGSITKKYYIIEFLEKYTKKHFLQTIKPFQRGGQGSVGLYTLDVGDKVKRYLFFCSTSPSSRTGKDQLIEKVTFLRTHYPEFIP